MKIRNYTPSADIGTQWQPAGSAPHPTQVTNSTFKPSKPHRSADSRTSFPKNETYFWPRAHSDSRKASTAPEQTPASLEFRQVTDAAHTTKPRSRLRRFIDFFFHPGKYQTLRKAEKAEKAAKKIKVTPANPKVFMRKDRDPVLNAAFQLGMNYPPQPYLAKYSVPQLPLGVLLSNKLNGNCPAFYPLHPYYPGFAPGFGLPVR